MTISLIRNVVSACALAACAASASAVPALQLGILGGVYDGGTETGVAQANSFKLYAFLGLGPQDTFDATAKYYISAALTPTLATPGGSFGSFTFAGQTVNVTADMDYGTPPLDAVFAAVYGDLQTHSIFPTYFSEFEFMFSALNKATDVNTQNNASLSGVTFSTDGTGDLYYAEFLVDVTNLSKNYAVHFDLYNTDIRNCVGQETCTTVVSSDDNAPFSKDAQSGLGGGGGGGGGGGTAPEPGTLALVGLALLGAGYARKRLSK